MDRSASECAEEKKRVIIEDAEYNMSRIPLVMELKKRIGYFAMRVYNGRNTSTMKLFPRITLFVHSLIFIKSK